MDIRLRTAALLLVLFGACSCRAAAAAATPNIILIMADDMGFSDVGCFGGEISTPNIDRLAREGMTFTQFYNNAKCTTTRASLLSGMYPRNNGSSIPDEIPTIAETMRAARYQTGMSGKWHLGSKPPQRPIDRGFGEYYGLMDGGVNYFNPAQPDPDFKGGRVRVYGHNDQRVTEFPAGYYTTDAFTDHAVATIRRFNRQRQPFFLHLSYTAPHYPLHAFPEDIAKYRGKYRQGWEELRRQRHARQLAAGLVDPQWKLPPLEGRSLAAVLRGGAREPHAQLFWQWSGNCAVREGRWKAVWDSLNPEKKWQLFDVEADRTEMHDLASDHPELVQRLTAVYDQWARALGRRLPGQEANRKKS